jgi:hypothetical protein
MKIFIWLLIVLAAGLPSACKSKTANAEMEAKQNEKDRKSKLEIFSSRAGVLYEKRFFDLGQLGQLPTLQVQSLTITDLQAKVSVSGLRFSCRLYKSYGGRDFVAFLDGDEIDGLLKSLAFLKGEVYSTSRDAYTEYVFISRSGFMAGAYWDAEKKWVPLIKFNSYDDESGLVLAHADADKLLALIQQAKDKFQAVPTRTETPSQ